MLEWLKLFPYWEHLAVVLAIAYLLLAIKESSWCWYCAFASTAIYTLLFWHVNLFMESALNVYYLVMAVYGWYEWRRGGSSHHGVHITHWPLKYHLIVSGIVLLASATSGYFLQHHTSAALPYLDSFTTWGSVITTYMVTRKVLENWLYWIVIDSVSIYLYVTRGLELTALLFVAYLVIVLFGFYRWKQQYRVESTALQSELAVE